MALTREQVEAYFKSQGRPWADEDLYDEFLNAGELQPLYDEIVQNGYDLPDVDRWFHLMDVMGVDLPFKTAMKIAEALWEADLEALELNLPEYRVFGEQKVNGIFRGSFDEVKERIRREVLQKEGFALGELGDVRIPDLKLEDAFKLYAELRGETDGAKTLFLMDSNRIFDLSRSEDTNLTPYEFKKIADQYLAPEDPLHAFIEQEVPFRMRQYNDIDISDKQCAELIDALEENVDVMFDYDRLDSFLMSKYEELAGLDSERIKNLRGEISVLMKELDGAIAYDPDKAPAIEKRLSELVDELNALRGVKPRTFIFDDELMVNASLDSVNGYLWAVDTLVDRIPGSDDMENINFYADYQAEYGTVSLDATYYTTLDGKEIQKCVEIELSGEEQSALLAAMEAYAQEEEGQSLLEMVNACRAEYELGPILPKNDSLPLEEQIQAAEARGERNSAAAGKPVLRDTSEREC